MNSPRNRNNTANCLRLLTAILIASTLRAEQHPKRVVILKFDGVPGWYVERALAEPGRTQSSWINHIFAKHGVRLRNFYTRGISLSAPAWQILDTGQHAQIRGNAEYDRYTGEVYDYLNFFPFYYGYSRNKTADMPSVEVLDDINYPLLIDRFPVEQRFQSFQLNQRGLRLKTLPKIITSRLASTKAKRLMDEWQAGFSFGQGVYEAMEQELIEKLKEPNVHYLDYFSGEFDHQAHLTNDPYSHAAVFEKNDRLIGRIFAAIEKSPRAADTIFVVVSDHGMNSVENIYSQGFSLVNFFTSAEGGGHHVITNRHVLQEYKLMGLDPFVNRVVTSSEDSPYLSGQHKRYPTVLLDLDGNERASVHLRNNHLNRLHMVLLQLPHNTSKLAPVAIEIIDSQRPKWTAALSKLREEITRLKRKIEATPAPERIKSKQFTPEELRKGEFLAAKRSRSLLENWKEAEHRYSAYANSLDRLLSLDRFTLEKLEFKIEDLIPPRAMGEPNSPEDLQSYAVELLSDGSFRTINYLETLTSLTTRNTPQKEVSPKPIDFIAMRDDERVLLYAGKEQRAVIETKHGKITYRPLNGWKHGLPLRILEDPELRIPYNTWLDEPHSEKEWLEALHKTKYSNGLISLTEHFGPPSSERRALVQADMLILANDHWNFNVRSFNPGGNHGSFFRISTHSTLMFWGGTNTGIPKGLVIDEPYDSLSFVPTILKLMGIKEDTKLPGQPIRFHGAN